jgi:S-adenosylmethionine:tRNA ribosyltransferase-isomerase
VAAPTAGLISQTGTGAFRPQGFGREEVTLHVGAGTFKPVKSETIEAHEMHAEFFSVSRTAIERILANQGHIIAVGTTSVRTLESLYYVGIRLAENPLAEGEELTVEQWMPYSEENNRLSVNEALEHILRI